MNDFISTSMLKKIQEEQTKELQRMHLLSTMSSQELLERSVSEFIYSSNAYSHLKFGQKVSQEELDQFYTIKLVGFSIETIDKNGTKVVVAKFTENSKFKLQKEIEVFLMSKTSFKLGIDELQMETFERHQMLNSQNEDEVALAIFARELELSTLQRASSDGVVHFSEPSSFELPNYFKTFISNPEMFDFETIAKAEPFIPHELLDLLSQSNGKTTFGLNLFLHNLEKQSSK